MNNIPPTYTARENALREEMNLIEIAINYIERAQFFNKEKEADDLLKEALEALRCTQEEITRGSGDVFKDIGVEKP